MVPVAAILASSTTFVGLFSAGLNDASPVYLELTQDMPSNGGQNTYQWKPFGVTIREWKGSRHYTEGGVYEYTLQNKDWEGTLTIPCNAYEDDSGAGLGLYEAEARELGIEAAYHPQDLAAEVLMGGFSANGPDGATFFGAAHPTHDNANNRTNLVSGNPVLNAANFEAGLDLLATQTKYNGRKLNLLGRGELVLITGPTLRSMAETILSQERLASGESNKNYKRARHIIWPELENYDNGDTAWFIAVVGAGVPKPLLRQMRKQPQLIEKTNPATSDHVFDKNEMVYGTHARYNVGYGHCEVIVGSNGSAS